MATPILIMSRQRSGAYALSSVFRRNGLPVFAEPFMARMYPEHSFSGFLEKYQILARDLMCEPERVLLAYIDHLERVGGCSKFALDVKHNQSHLFNGPVYLPGDKPGLIEIFQTQGFFILHLVRRNLVAQFMSIELAGRTGIFHRKKHESHPTAKPFAVNVNRAKLFVRRAEESLSRMQAWNRQYPNYFELAYEDAFHEGRLSSLAASRLGEVLETRITDCESDYAKFGYDLRSLVLNSKELIAAFGATRHSQDARALLG